jgi:lipopolysaccharide transport system permease protein
MLEQVEAVPLTDEDALPDSSIRNPQSAKGNLKSQISSLESEMDSIRNPQPAIRNSPLPSLRIQPSTGWVSLKLGEIWEYRELLYFLTWRDIKVRYKQTALGAAWAIIQPFFTMLVFSLFFGRLAKIPSDGVPYPIFSFAALVPWTFFANGLTQSSNSLVGSSNLITKVYFPRLIIPISSVISGVIDFALAMLVLFAMMLYYRVSPTINVLFLPLFVLLAFVTSLGVGLWLSALNVEYRDVRYVLPFVVQFWMFATPIAYPSTLLHDPWRTIYGLNPMVGVIEGFRWALLGTATAPGPIIFVSSLAALLILLFGALYFRRMEKTFADVV